MAFVSRYGDVRQVLLDQEALSSHGNFILDGDDSDSPLALIMQSDPPEDTASRDLLRPGFRRASMSDAAPWIGERATELMDRLPDRGPADIVGDIAMPLTATVISRLIGVPQGDAAELSLAITEIIPGNFLQSDVWTELESYFVEQARRRRAAVSTPDDLLTRLVTGRPAGELLTDREVWSVKSACAAARPSDGSCAVRGTDCGRCCDGGTWSASSGGTGVREPRRDHVPLSRRRVRVPGESARASTSPLSHGMHLCLGAELSQTEITSTLSHLLDRMPGFACLTYHGVTSTVSAVHVGSTSGEAGAAPSASRIFL
ncbi:hypothetical protein AB0M48_30175 [Lentzea sp. NPDC051208]|uniref:hypothetical protein n=1 Tax=Lentzea sp. NPDC051208 TaxID=3154642 RepID=UPI00343D9688